MKWTFFLIVVLLTFSVALAMNFKPPDSAERLKAIGPTKGLLETLRKALDPADDFDPEGTRTLNLRIDRPEFSFRKNLITKNLESFQNRAYRQAY
jgi:hypothetical protein